MSAVDEKNSSKSDSARAEFNLVTFNIDGENEGKSLTETVKASLVFRISAVQDYPNHSYVHIGKPGRSQCIIAEHSPEEAIAMVKEALSI
jgi:hypothetical protein